MITVVFCILINLQTLVDTRMTTLQRGGVDTLELPLTPGDSVFNATKEYCKTVSRDDCITVMDKFSDALYGRTYTPSRPTSTHLDFTTTPADIVVYLQKRYNLRNYLEIGCWLDNTFSVVKGLVDVAIGVDPSSGGTLRMTSTEFFLSNTKMFDLIFIDGLHEGHQVVCILSCNLIASCCTDLYRLSVNILYAKYEIIMRRYISIYEV